MKKRVFSLILLFIVVVFISSMTTGNRISLPNIVHGYQDTTGMLGTNSITEYTLPRPTANFYGYPVEGCSSFCLSNPISCVFGTNLDLFFTSGQLFVNKKNMVKAGREASTTGKRAVWTSKFGSLTFNVVGYQNACTGMNEAGLVISTMNLPQTKMPVPDQRPPLDNAFWVQYQLDNCATVEEVIASDSRVRITPTPPGGNHYLVCDKKGDCAVIEFLDGKMVYYTGGNLPVNVLTNSTYKESVKAWRENKLYGESIPRFARAADQVKNKYMFASNKATIYYAFYTLSVISTPITVWSVVFDNQELQVYFISQRNQQMRCIDFKKLDFSSKTPVLMLDVHAQLAGDISDRLLPYSHQASLAQMKKAFNEFVPDMSDIEIEDILKFFEDFPYAESIENSPKE